ncbi:GNAT family N-acetyltransferase [Flavobacterium sp.]|uniref:GNAT family N-acetyltransferase n=1 Tax=Flavobacterium sp. TaxID=239 RepID=UPI002FDA0967
MITIKTLENTSLETIMNTFNLAFSDYMLPMQITREQLESKIKNENVKLEYCVGAFENNQLIAFMLHGQDIINGKNTLYNGGTGVIPTKRGNHLTLKLYEFLLPQLKTAKIAAVKLEVITTNKPAITTYEKSGFQIIRKLNCYKGSISQQQPSDTYKISTLIDFDWTKLTSFWDWTPTWQNDTTAIENNKENAILLGIHAASELAGYLIFNPKSNRIQQFAIAHEYRNKGLATQLFSYIASKYDAETVIINIDSADVPTNRFLEKIGFQKLIEQYEMVLEI